MDVKSLHTNIHYEEDKEAVKETRNAQADRTIATKVLIKFLFLILALNNFIFNNINYIRIKCWMMGTICNTTEPACFI